MDGYPHLLTNHEVTPTHTFHRLDRTSLQLHTISQAQQGQLTAVAFAPGQPEAVATSSTDGSIYVWSTAVGAGVRDEMTGCGDGVRLC